MANQSAKSHLLCLFVLAGLASSACYDPFIEDDMRYPGAKMVRRYTAYPEEMGAPEQGGAPYPQQPNSAHWGQKLVMPGPWLQDQRRPLLRLDKIEINRLPVVQNIVLSANPTGDYVAAAGVLFRWELTVGCGGGNTTFILDAGGLQQLSVSAEQMTLSLFATTLGAQMTFAPAFVAPTYSMEGTVFFADGSTSTDPPTFSEYFDLTVSGGAKPLINVPIPNGANGFRLLGSPSVSATSPFSATAFYRLVDISGVAIDIWRGSDIEGVRIAQIPVNSNMHTLQIENTSAVVPVTPGVIEWSFDL